MVLITTVTYRYNINGGHSKLMKAERGIRQGDPISPYLFVIVMEYMSMLLHQMQLNPNYNHHSKCVLSDSTGLVVNPSKFQVYMGAINEITKQQILNVTGFKEGKLPFRYLGVPLTCKKLSVAHYLPLIDKILNRLQHWSSRLLSHACRMQLVKAVGFAIANYWLQYFPIPKSVLQKIQSACKTFIWTGGTSPSRKSSVSWKTMCKPRVKGGLNILDLDSWNTITMMKLLWDLRKKTVCLWVKWMSMYFLKGKDPMSMVANNNSSWISKGILNARHVIPEVQSCWDKSINGNKFRMGEFYKGLMSQATNVDLRSILEGNIARPRAVFYLWLACHKRLATKTRLKKFGVVIDSKCCFFQEEETLDHLLFGCEPMKYIWTKVLQWIHVDRHPR
ncbi:uncharacterized protein LOC131627878 [Vicia villosa]|uniref:uncharacterized protein LOC131627878 n=1 Tax=Vicia villosa TaxID=3911 RepID=UPI00273B2D80|nr:uncharacterized protein LOC131627878 [Vicia villosa]